ncbi:hypothetical protein J4H86_03775 [Spiractinospora alimapuensis]|uniref:hypothetical protein n=1 Tax=Spiractinospora alimapuensis TaxID=2820884 RepID=UPI001F33C7CC|nr:hypothetical protein [Spiractinospora alimapuensis]QVQ52945.1 hypothetical protein J4H86_03775 [Spiractinospora alimapuensis]
MVRLRRIPLTVVPEHGLLRLRGPLAPGGGVVNGSGGDVLLECGADHVSMRTLQGRIEVGVVVEEWDVPPPDSSPGEESEDATADVLLPGHAVLDTGFARRLWAGPLLGGAGTYRIHVRADGRHSVAAGYDRLLRDAGEHSEALRRAHEHLRGRERFLIRIWRIPSTG